MEKRILQEERQRMAKRQKSEYDILETDGPNVREDVAQIGDRGHSVPEASANKAERSYGASQKTVSHTACLICSLPVNDLEDDGIKTRRIEERILCQRPKEIPSDYPDTRPGKRRRTIFCMCGSEQKPKNCRTTKIYIVHKNADKPEGDPFGAYLRTYTDELEDGSLYNKHFLQKIQDNSPAGKMRFRDNDEIGLFNEIFAPHLDHKELLKKFREVKVDGKTRFSLIIRRTETRYKAKRSEWIKISAIFVPEKPKEHEPVVVGQEETPLGDNGYDIVTKILLRIPGSQKFLELKDNTVSADVLDGMYDKTKDLSKRTHYKLDDADHITYYSSLCDVENKRFVSVDESNNVIVDMTGYVFRWTREGGEVQFELNSEDRYLAFQTDRKIAIVQSEKFRFEEFPADEYYIKKALFEQQRVNSRYTGDEATSDRSCTQHPVGRQTARDLCVLGSAELSVTPDPSVSPTSIPVSTTEEINPEKRHFEDMTVPSDLNKGFSTKCADKSKQCLSGRRGFDDIFLSSDPSESSIDRQISSASSGVGSSVVSLSLSQRSDSSFGGQSMDYDLEQNSQPNDTDDPAYDSGRCSPESIDTSEGDLAPKNILLFPSLKEKLPSALKFNKSFCKDSTSSQSLHDKPNESKTPVTPLKRLNLTWHESNE